MSELKDFPTDNDYEGNPEYYADFLRNQEVHRKDLEGFMDLAGNNNELEWLGNQMVVVGVKQTGIKSWLVKQVLDNVLPVPSWDGKTSIQLRELIMEADSNVPRWQRNEMIFAIDMYHDILVKMDGLQSKRGNGQ